MKSILVFILILGGLLLVGCSKPKAGICSVCPVWFLDPICLSGGDAPNPIEPKEKAPPPIEADLIPGQEKATLKK